MKYLIVCILVAVIAAVAITASTMENTCEKKGGVQISAFCVKKEVIL